MHVFRYASMLVATLVLVAIGAHAQAPATAGKPAPAPATAPAGKSDDHLSAIAQKLRQNKNALHAYHWKEAILVEVNGAEKTRAVNSCDYDGEGRLIRKAETVPASEQPASGKNLPGSPTEITTYVNSAFALLRLYVLPDPDKLEKCRDAGHETVTTEGTRLKLVFKSYEKDGDDLTLEVNPATNQIISLVARTYLVNRNDTAKISAETALLPDGTSYPARVKLDTPARGMGAGITNSDYRKKTS